MPEPADAPGALLGATHEVGWRRVLAARTALIVVWPNLPVDDVHTVRALAGLFALDALIRAHTVARLVPRSPDAKAWDALTLLVERRRSDLMLMTGAEPSAQRGRVEWPAEGDSERRLSNAWARLTHDARAGLAGFEKVIEAETQRLALLGAATSSSARRALSRELEHALVPMDELARVWNLHRTVAAAIEPHGFGEAFARVWREVEEYGPDGLVELPWYRPPMSAAPPAAGSEGPPDTAPQAGAKPPRDRFGWLRRGGGDAPSTPRTRSRGRPATRGPAAPPPPPAPPATAGAAPEAEPPPAQARELRRTPHLDLSSDQAAPGDTIQVWVWADRQAARAAEESEDVVVALPEHVHHVELKCYLLASPQLEVVGPATLPLRLEEARDATDRIEFRVRVRPAAEILELPPQVLPLPTRASVSAVFAHNGRPSGSVTRMLDIQVDAPAAAGVEVRERTASGTLRLDPAARSPDLLVQVRAQPINDGRQFQCRVSTPLIEAPEEDTWADWNLPGRTDELVRGWMADFVADDLSPRQRLAALNGAGAQLWDAAPALFRTLYWRLVDAGHAPRSIAIVSDEPFIPWELMTPHRRVDRKRERRAALGVEAAVGRWILEQGTAAPQRLSASESVVIAPRYQGSRALAFSDEEAALVLEHFPGIRIEPASLDVIEEQLATLSAGLLHFVCHGSAGDEGPAQTVYLENEERLNTTMLAGLPGFQALLESGNTLVVLNACEVGRPSPALIGVGGFARTFIDLGAAAVLAALWSVKDTIAHGVARDFYAAARAEPHRPLADIVREIRARSWSDPAAEDTYAAYCFYGDPQASLAD